MLTWLKEWLFYIKLKKWYNKDAFKYSHYCGYFLKYGVPINTIVFYKTIQIGGYNVQFDENNEGVYNFEEFTTKCLQEILTFIKTYALKELYTKYEKLKQTLVTIPSKYEITYEQHLNYRHVYINGKLQDKIYINNSFEYYINSKEVYTSFEDAENAIIKNYENKLKSQNNEIHNKLHKIIQTIHILEN